jgi:hypothetical protein
MGVASCLGAVSGEKYYLHADKTSFSRERGFFVCYLDALSDERRKK